MSATLAPVLLIGGWTLAAQLQPAGFDSATDTISALAGLGATDRWVMTTALLGLGACHVTTASGLPAAAPAGRVLLAIGGIATMAVAALPLPAVGSSAAHTTAAGIAFVALSAWPLVAWRRSRSAIRAQVRGDEPHSGATRDDQPSAPQSLGGERSSQGGTGVVPWALRPMSSISASIALFILLGGFGVALSRSEFVGGAERITAAAQAVWPLVVVWSVKLTRPIDG
ncbi:MAG: DUF998 domain-containing protein [Candidatus Nanopelagicales bacterium]